MATAVFTNPNPLSWPGWRWRQPGAHEQCGAHKDDESIAARAGYPLPSSVEHLADAPKIFEECNDKHLVGLGRHPCRKCSYLQAEALVSVSLSLPIARVSEGVVLVNLALLLNTDG